MPYTYLKRLSACSVFCLRNRLAVPIESYHPFLDVSGIISDHTLTMARLVTFTEQAHHAYRPLWGGLPCPVRPICPHRASVHTFHLPEMAIGLLGVLPED